MAYIELKPLTTPAYTGDINQYMKDLVFTFPRDRVPLLLEGRLTLGAWMSTYDNLLERYRLAMEDCDECIQKHRWMMAPFVLPCLIPVFFPFMFYSFSKISQKARDHEQAFVQLAEDQADIYQQYGIQVTLAKELRRYGSDDGTPTRQKNLKDVIVGLRFDVGSLAWDPCFSANEQRLTQNPTDIPGRIPLSL
ncbi:expressed unknown protein [Seminavis robusta]|uniref:Uncharacterized protein n=1 Tax=Seminavis robusta TaxID=568900 RepID=A0A9N8HCI2_9STRA|nr:expressed unknown protein [Seminavis robusta]|eukprot:Sro320_g116470.1 n/a (193) ;mRNA; r:21585-22163